MVSARLFKESRATFQQVIPPDEPVAFLGARYWSKASPLLYYAERRLEWPAPSASQALQLASARASRLLLCDRARLGEIDAAMVPYRVVLDSREWVLLELLP